MCSNLRLLLYYTKWMANVLPQTLPIEITLSELDCTALLPHTELTCLQLVLGTLIICQLVLRDFPSGP